MTDEELAEKTRSLHQLCDRIFELQPRHMTPLEYSSACVRVAMYALQCAGLSGTEALDKLEILLREMREEWSQMTGRGVA